MSGPRVAVCACPPHEVALQQRADSLSASLSIPKTKVASADCDLLLAVTPDRLELRVLGGEEDLVGGHPLCAQLESIDTTSPAGRKLDMPLLKAVGIKKGQPHRPKVLDCTAGLGEDAWLLASHGCKVLAYERQPVVAALLCDAIRRAADVYPDTADRIDVCWVDAIEVFRPDGVEVATLESSDPKPLPDAITIDPMFPLSRKAKERKPMRVLRMLAGDDDDAPELLAMALTTGIHRVCVKRPLKAPVIANEKRPAPDVVYKGKAVRFDVYLNH